MRRAAKSKCAFCGREGALSSAPRADWKARERFGIRGEHTERNDNVPFEVGPDDLDRTRWRKRPTHPGKSNAGRHTPALVAIGHGGPLGQRDLLRVRIPPRAFAVCHRTPASTQGSARALSRYFEAFSVRTDFWFSLHRLRNGSGSPRDWRRRVPGPRRDWLRGRSEGTPRAAVGQLQVALDSPEVGRMIYALEYVRWTGRPSYPVRAGMRLVKSLYALPTWSRTCCLVAEHPPTDDSPSTRQPDDPDQVDVGADEGGAAPLAASAPLSGLDNLAVGQLHGCGIDPVDFPPNRDDVSPPQEGESVLDVLTIPEHHEYGEGPCFGFVVDRYLLEPLPRTNVADDSRDLYPLPVERVGLVLGLYGCLSIEQADQFQGRPENECPGGTRRLLA